MNNNEPNETVSPGGIILPSMPQEPEPPQPEEPKESSWSFAIGADYDARYNPESARKALEALYRYCDPGGGVIRSEDQQLRYERRLSLLNQLAFEIMGEIPVYEQLC